MIFAHKILNSGQKKNLQFIAAGSYQIECFQLNDKEYFSIHRLMPQSWNYFLIEILQSDICQVDENQYHIENGFSTYKLRFSGSENRRQFHVTRYLWGWLPVARFGGAISSRGTITLRSILNHYLKLSN